MSRRSSPTRAGSRGKGSPSKKDDAAKPTGPLEPSDVVRGWADTYQKRALATQTPTIPSALNLMYEAIGDNMFLSKLVFQSKQTVLKEGALACLFASARSVFYSHLTMIYFWRLAVSEDDVEALGHFLSKYGYIHTLELINNDFSLRCAIKLGSMLALNRGLRTLVLDLNVFGPSALASISAGLCTPGVGIQTLSLNYCQCGPDGAQHLAAIIRGSTVRELRLDGNKLRSAGAKEVLGALCDNHTVEILSLADNMIDLEPSIQAMTAFRQALSTENAILKVDLDMNLLSPRAAGLVLEGLSERRLRRYRGVDIRVTHRLPTAILDNFDKLCERLIEPKTRRKKSAGKGGRGGSGSGRRK